MIVGSPKYSKNPLFHSACSEFYKKDWEFAFLKGVVAAHYSALSTFSDLALFTFINNSSLDVDGFHTLNDVKDLCNTSFFNPQKDVPFTFRGHCSLLQVIARSGYISSGSVFGTFKFKDDALFIAKSSPCHGLYCSHYL